MSNSIRARSFNDSNYPQFKMRDPTLSTQFFFKVIVLRCCLVVNYFSVNLWHTVRRVNESSCKIDRNFPLLEVNLQIQLLFASHTKPESFQLTEVSKLADLNSIHNGELHLKIEFSIQLQTEQTPRKQVHRIIKIVFLIVREFLSQWTYVPCQMLFTFDRWLLKHVSSSHWGPVIEERRENLVLHDLNMTCFISTLIFDVQDNVKFSILWILFLLARDLLMERFQLFGEHSKPTLLRMWVYFSATHAVCSSCAQHQLELASLISGKRFWSILVSKANNFWQQSDGTDRHFYGWSSKFALESENTAVYYNLNNPPKDERPSSKHRVHTCCHRRQERIHH